MICEEVRELLPEHLLGTLDPDADGEVRRHVRGCAACRADMTALGEGLTRFARAAHDREPPGELHDRVFSVLEQEWTDGAEAVRPASRWTAVIGVAAAIAILVAAVGFGLAAGQRADLAQADAASYQRLLEALGGKEFRVGEIGSQASPEVEGSVVLYDSHQGQSWGVVLVRAPGRTGTATATLEAPGGRSIEVGELRFAEDGDAATWIVTGSSLEPYDHLTIRLPDGSEMAEATIEAA